MCDAVHVTQDLVLQQIVELRKAGYRSIKAGHEADGQLGYMARKRLADFVMSEDGDIIVHGAPRVLTAAAETVE